MPDPDIAAFRRGRITAAAGHGKTHLIAHHLLAHAERLPALVLTHTNAGVRALRERLDRLAVPRRAYWLQTLSAFSMMLVVRFPQRSGVVLVRDEPGDDYEAVLMGAERLAVSGVLDSLLPRNFARLIVDEYQDCTIPQHNFILELSRSLPTTVLGDPLQGIFDFDDRGQVDWDRHVGTSFDEHGTLDIPHRWQRGGNGDLGEWLLDVRRCLLGGHPVDLRSARSGTTHHFCRPGRTAFDVHCYVARGPARSAGETRLVIGHSQEHRRLSIVGRVPGLFPVERKELGDSLIAFADSLMQFDDTTVEQVLSYAGTMMTGVKPAGTLRRARSHLSGRSRTAATPIEASVRELLERTDYPAVRSFLACCRAQTPRCYRPDLLRLTIESLDAVITNNAPNIRVAAQRSRDRFRHQTPQRHASQIGNVHLLKGLECDHAGVLCADELNARELYVALSRARHSVQVCSESPVLSARIPDIP